MDKILREIRIAPAESNELKLACTMPNERNSNTQTYNQKELSKTLSDRSCYYYGLLDHSVMMVVSVRFT